MTGNSQNVFECPGWNFCPYMEFLNTFDILELDHGFEMVVNSICSATILFAFPKFYLTY